MRGRLTAVQPAAAHSRVRQIAAGLSRCLTQLDEQGLKDRCATLGTLERSAPQPQEIYDFVLRAVSPDPLADLVAHFQDRGATATGRVVALKTTLAGDGIVHVLGAGSVLEDARPAVVVAETAKAGTLPVAWDAPHVVVIKTMPVHHGAVYKLPTGLGAVAAPENHRPPTHAEIARCYRDDTMPAIACALLQACGISP